MEFPSNGGWKFRQPQFGNWENKMAMVGEDASIKYIIKARQANPAISAKHNLSTDYATVQRELIAFQQARGALPQTQPTFFAPARSSLPERVVAVAGNIKRAAQGSAVWLDWLAHGGIPEAQPLPEKRAQTCVNCIKNVPGEWYVNAPAELLKSAIEEWKRATGKDFSFETSQGDNLKSCGVCLCLSKIKVFVPLKHILEKTKPEILAEFPPNCWIANRDI